MFPFLFDFIEAKAHRSNRPIWSSSFVSIFIRLHRSQRFCWRCFDLSCCSFPFLFDFKEAKEFLAHALTGAMSRKSFHFYSTSKKPKNPFSQAVNRRHRLSIFIRLHRSQSLKIVAGDSGNDERFPFLFDFIEAKAKNCFSPPTGTKVSIFIRLHRSQRIGIADEIKKLSEVSIFIRLHRSQSFNFDPQINLLSSGGFHFYSTS